MVYVSPSLQVEEGGILIAIVQAVHRVGIRRETKNLHGGGTEDGIRGANYIWVALRPAGGEKNMEECQLTRSLQHHSEGGG